MLINTAQLLRRTGCVLSFCAFAVLSCQASASDMATAGQFEVTNNGAASFTIPIELPPGVAGVVPKLSLGFSSQQGNDALGVGWSLGGLSAVSRCGKTIAQDGVSAPITYTSTDTYCLDGQKLVRYQSGSAGWDGVEWRTEIDSFSKVISYGTAGNGPAWFKVWTKAGEIIEYGNAADSRIETSNASDVTVKVWAVNKVSDTRGNYYSVTYQEDRTNGDYYPLEIDYTGNATASPAVAPISAVKFGYTGRSDGVALYFAGRVGKTVQRLGSISVFSSGNQTRYYALNYGSSSQTNRSVLTSIQECAGSVCKPSVSLTWAYTALSADRYGAAVSTPLCANGSNQYGTCNDTDNVSYIRYPDVNGDGRADVCYRSDSGIRCYAGTATGFDLSAPLVSTTICKNGGGSGDGVCNDSDNFQTIDYPDVDGDGKADLVYRGDQGVQLWLSSSSPFGTHVSYTFCANGSSQFGSCDSSDNIYTIRFPDINGDGRADVCFRSDSGISCLLSVDGQWDDAHPILTNICANGSSNYGVCNDANNFSTIDYADFNGDGRADLTFRSDSGIQIALSTGNGFAWTYSSDICADGSSKYGVCNDGNNYDYIRHPDINGDGLPDTCFRGDNGIQCILWTGTGWDYSHQINTAICADSSSAYGVCNDANNYNTIAYADMNGDGMADLIYRSDNGMQIWFFNGTTFSDQKSYSICNDASGCDKYNYKLIQLVDINGDGIPDILSRLNNGITIYFGQGTPTDQLTSISNGLGLTTSVSYKPLTDDTVYTKDGPSSALPFYYQYPITDVQVPMYVVSSSQTSNGIGGFLNSVYSYGGLKVDQSGRGMLGFRWMKITQSDTNLVSYTKYRQDFPYIGMPYQYYKSVTSGTTPLLNRNFSMGCLNPADGTACVIAPGKRYFPYTSEIDEYRADLSGADLGFVQTNTAYDNYGNPTSITTVTPDGFKKVTANTYINDTTKWLLGRLTWSSVDSTSPAGHQLRTSAFTYDGTGLLNKEVIEPSSSAYCLATEYVYDVFGNKTKSTVRNCNGSALSGGAEAAAPTGDPVFSARTSNVGFDTNGRFPLSSTNALNQSESSTYDQILGVVKSHTGPNNLTTTWSYDGFGRPTLEVRPDANQTKTEYQYCSGYNRGTATCPSNATYVVMQTPMSSSGAVNGIVVSSYIDSLGRSIRTEQADSLFTTRQDYAYDSIGQLAKKSRPYHVGDPIYWIQNGYDGLGRVTSETGADGAVTSTVYNGFVTTITNALGQTKTNTFNSQNQLMSTKDTAGNRISYIYDPEGNLKTVTDSSGNQQVLYYDQRGRKIEMQDPDLGDWHYYYNALGELIRQTDAKSQTVSMQYDLLGRLVQRHEPDMTSFWYYDAYKDGSVCSKGIGKLCELTSDTGYDRKLAFDGLGRPVQTDIVIDKTYTSSVSYNADGRVDTQTDPQGFAVKYTYLNDGHLWRLNNVASGAEYWHASNWDAEGHLTQQVDGNTVETDQTFDPKNGRLLTIYAWHPGLLATSAPVVVQNLSYQYDKLGNVTGRNDTKNGATDSFIYDELNRLKHSTVNAADIQYNYDALGNITYRSDVGTYAYPVSGAGVLRPHALKNMALSSGNQRTYGYDANGNLTSEVETNSAGTVQAGKGRTTTYTSFNMASTITRPSGGLLSPAVNVSYQYDPDHQRVKQTIGSVSTIYLNPPGGAGLYYEREIKSSTSEEHRHFIAADGEAVAMVTTSKSGGSAKTLYMHHDGLGSLVAVTTASKSIDDTLSYEPFGKRRKANGAADTNDSLTGKDSDRGFTMHEHVDDLVLINMNGRMYDPKIGRFMSADPFVSDPQNQQSYNRYSYVGNNPMGYTDPSGYLWNPFKAAKHLGRGMLTSTYNPLKGFAMQWQSVPGSSRVDHFVMSHPWAYAAGQIVTGGLTVACFGCGAAVFSAYYSYESTGSLTAGYRAGAITEGTALAFHAVGIYLAPDGLGGTAANLAGHAIVGCASSAASGGQCGSGAAAGFVGDVFTLGAARFGVEPQFAASVAGGGFASLIVGGGFANGAVTGAFGFLFNYCLDNGNCVLQQTSQEGIDFIKGFESFRGSVYSDSAGNPTIGYGHLLSGEQIDLFSGGVSLAQGNSLLQVDVAKAEAVVNKLKVTVPLSQQQFDALVSFTFNAGPRALETSGISGFLRTGHIYDAATAFGQITRSGMTHPPGLPFRRASESDLFLNGEY